MTKRFLAVAFAFATTFAMANNGQEENVKPATTQQTEQTLSYEEIFKRTEEDAVTCEIETDRIKIKCTGCDCGKIAEKVLKAE